VLSELTFCCAMLSDANLKIDGNFLTKCRSRFEKVNFDHSEKVVLVV
jgi:hypothetical protein